MMKYDLSNRVIARSGSNGKHVQNRSLDLGNIFTPELVLLSPNRNEIAPRGLSRDQALSVYSERLRDSYRNNENGFRDGMVMLGEAYRTGQSISITCFCRAGQLCHADVVKLAIEKVARALDVREHGNTQDNSPVQDASFRPSNSRTERAVNEILSFSQSEAELLRLNDTQGRNRSEHASHLNRRSQFLRETYERGGTVENGVLVIPRENPHSPSQLQISTAEYGVRRLAKIVGEKSARETVQQVVENGKAIAGSFADRETEAKVFRWIYEALEGKEKLLDVSEEQTLEESRKETFDRTLSEIAGLAREMKALEPVDLLHAGQHLEGKSEYESDSKSVDETELEEPTEFHFEQADESSCPTNGFERIDFGVTPLGLIASEMSAEEIEEWSKTKFPALDEALENGIKPSVIVKLYKARMDKDLKNGSRGKELHFEDLRFAHAYMEYQLNQPETRLRHYNERYRDFAQRLDLCRTREEVIEVSSRIRTENSKVAVQDERGAADPLSAREMQYLFTEQPPRHYTSEMTVAKLNYAVSGYDKLTKTDALIKGDILPTPEAQKLVESLESRKERHYIEESLSATKHFLKSLNTPDEKLRIRNGFDHKTVYEKLAPAEKDFVYRSAIEQRDQLEKTLQNVADRSSVSESNNVVVNDLQIEKLQETIKLEMAALAVPGTDRLAIEGKTSSLITDHLHEVGIQNIDSQKAVELSKELSSAVFMNEDRRGLQLVNSTTPKHPLDTSSTRHMVKDLENEYDISR